MDGAVPLDPHRFLESGTNGSDPTGRALQIDCLTTSMSDRMALCSFLPYADGAIKPREES
jgi:hypothetical protein